MGREGGKEGEKHWCVRDTSTGCLSHTPNQGPGLQPRHVPWLGLELATPWFIGQSSIHWATPARAHLYVVLCVHHPKSSLRPSLFNPRLSSSTSFQPLFPFGNHHAVVWVWEAFLCLIPPPLHPAPSPRDPSLPWDCHLSPYSTPTPSMPVFPLVSQSHMQPSASASTVSLVFSAHDCNTQAARWGGALWFGLREYLPESLKPSFIIGQVHSPILSLGLSDLGCPGMNPVSLGTKQSRVLRAQVTGCSDLLLPDPSLGTGVYELCSLCSLAWAPGVGESDVPLCFPSCILSANCFISLWSGVS